MKDSACHSIAAFALTVFSTVCWITFFVNPALTQVQGRFAGVSQCWNGSSWVTVQGNCPSQNGGGGTSPSSANSVVYNGFYQLGYQFGQWLFGGGSNFQAAAQQRVLEQQMMAEIARRQAEAQRLHQEEEARQLAAMYQRLDYALKHRELPDLQLKERSDSGPGLQLKMRDIDSGQAGIKGLPGIYLNDGKPTPYGIPGLPGVYTGGPGQGSGLSNPPLAIKTRGSEMANTANNAPAPVSPADNTQNSAPAAPAAEGSQPAITTDTGLQYKGREESGETAQPPASAGQPTDFDPSKMTPQQLADAAEAFNKLPPEEQQRIMAAAQRDAASGQPSLMPKISTMEPVQPGTAPTNAAAPSSSQPAIPQATAGVAARPGATALTQLQQQAAASQSAAAAPNLEGASAQAGAGFDQPAGQPSAGPVALTGTTPALLRPPEPPPTPNYPTPPSPTVDALASAPAASVLDQIRQYLFPLSPAGARPFPKDPNPPLRNPLRDEQQLQVLFKAWDHWAIERATHVSDPAAASQYPSATERMMLNASAVQQYAPELLARYNSDPAFRQRIDERLARANDVVALEYYQAIADAHKAAIQLYQEELEKLMDSGKLDRSKSLEDQFERHPDRRQLVQDARERVDVSEEAALFNAQSQLSGQMSKEYQCAFQLIRGESVQSK